MRALRCNSCTVGLHVGFDNILQSDGVLTTPSCVKAKWCFFPLVLSALSHLVPSSLAQSELLRLLIRKTGLGINPRTRRFIQPVDMPVHEQIWVTLKHHFYVYPRHVSPIQCTAKYLNPWCYQASLLYLQAVSFAPSQEVPSLSWLATQWLVLVLL